MCTWPPNTFTGIHLITRITEIIIIGSDFNFWEVKYMYKPHKNVSFEQFESNFINATNLVKFEQFEH